MLSIGDIFMNNIGLVLVFFMGYVLLFVSYIWGKGILDLMLLKMFY